MPEYTVAAILPPGSMRRVVADIKRSICGLCAAVSPFALPALVPVAFTRSSPSPRAFADRLRSSLPAMVCTLGEYVVHGGGLFLTITGEGLEEARRLVGEAAGGDGGPALFPAFSGILLGAEDVTPHVEEIRDSIGVPQERRFGAYSVSLLLIRCRSVERWWEQVWWEELCVVSVK